MMLYDYDMEKHIKSEKHMSMSGGWNKEWNVGERKQKKLWRQDGGKKEKVWKKSWMIWVNQNNTSEHCWVIKKYLKLE